MTRGSFLKLKIPNLPYCHFPYRGASNQFWESFHIYNTNKRVQINVYWKNCGYSTAVNNSDEGEVSVSLHDEKIKNPWKQKKLVMESTKRFSNKKFINVFKEIMA